MEGGQMVAVSLLHWIQSGMMCKMWPCWYMLLLHFEHKGAENGNHHRNCLLHAVYLSGSDPKSPHFGEEPDASCQSTKNWIINMTFVLWILIKGFSALALLVLRAKKFFDEGKEWSPCGMCSNNTGLDPREPFLCTVSLIVVASTIPRHCWMSPENYDCLSSSHGW